MARFFLSHRANHPVSINGRNYSFLPTSAAAGLVFGVFEAATAEAEADLLQVVARGVGVEEISASDFEAEKKRTQIDSSKFSSPLRPVSLPQPSPSIDHVQPAASVKPPDEQAATRIIPLTAKSVVRIERVASPNAIVADSERLKND